MAIGVVATLKVHEGKGDEFEAVYKELVKAVRANEPGNTLYQLCRSRKDKNTYVFMEIYESDAALQAHAKSDQFRAIAAQMGRLVAGSPDVQHLDFV